MRAFVRFLVVAGAVGVLAPWQISAQQISPGTGGPSPAGTVLPPRSASGGEYLGPMGDAFFPGPGQTGNSCSFFDAFGSSSLCPPAPFYSYSCQCDTKKKPLGGIPWTISWSQAPACVQNKAAYVYEVKVKNIKNACQNSSDSFADICLEMPTCAHGVDLVYVYPTIPFQQFNGGVPTTGGGNIPSCGLAYQLLGSGAITGWWCQNLADPYGLGGPHCLTNEFEFKAFCDSLDELKLRLDCNAFTAMLALYQSLGLYGSSPGSFLTDESVVFTVIVKCCNNDGTGDCSC